MSNIVSFRPSRNAKILLGDRGRGEILFFTGVRYIRDDGPAEPVSPVAKRRRKLPPAAVERLEA